MTSQQEAHASGGKPGLLAISLTFACCFGLFCLFTAKFSAAELSLAAVSSAACTCFALLLLRCAPSVRFSWADVAQVWRVPGYIVQRVAQITWLLVRDLCGNRVSSIFRRTAFRGGHFDSAGAARRVLATLYTTAAPNFIVLEIDPERQTLHFHQLTRTGISDMLQNLGAKP